MAGRHVLREPCSGALHPASPDSRSISSSTTSPEGLPESPWVLVRFSQQEETSPGHSPGGQPGDAVFWNIAGRAPAFASCEPLSGEGVCLEGLGGKELTAWGQGGTLATQGPLQRGRFPPGTSQGWGGRCAGREAPGLMSGQADPAGWSSPSLQRPRGVSVSITEPKSRGSAEISCMEITKNAPSTPRDPTGTYIRQTQAAQRHSR